mgnify:CR=1 FL=1
MNATKSPHICLCCQGTTRGKKREWATECVLALRQVQCNSGKVKKLNNSNNKTSNNGNKTGVLSQFHWRNKCTNEPLDGQKGGRIKWYNCQNETLYWHWPGPSTPGSCIVILDFKFSRDQETKLQCHCGWYQGWQIIF